MKDTVQACIPNRVRCVRLFVTLWTVAHQAPLSMGFSRQEYWSGLPFPPPGDLPNPGIEPMLPAAPALQADSSPLSHQGRPKDTACVCAVAQSGPTLCNLLDFSSPGSSVHGILQARLLEWVAISFSKGYSTCPQIFWSIVANVK